MEQMRLPVLTVYDGPRLVNVEAVRACTTYRAAVRACWMMRTRRGLTQRQLAEEAGLYASHITDYVSDDHGKRELPARHVNVFEIACGNRFITQWLARQANLTILEQFVEQPRRAIA